MNIISFRASNIKRLIAVAIDPKGALVRLTGANGSGKSSTLDGIYYALAGVSTIPSNPIRDGAETAEVSLSLGVEGVLKYKVTRKFTRGKTSQVIVESPDGARYASPQALLDRLFGSLTFDPEVFGRMSAKEQLNQLKTLVKLDVDVDALDAQNKADFENRTEVNRRVKQLKESVDLYAGGLKADMTVDPIDVAEMLRQIEAASERNRYVDDVARQLEQSKSKIADYRARAKKAREDAEGLLQGAGALERQADQMEKENDAVDVLVAVDISDLSRAVQDATKENTARQLQRDQRKKHSDAVAAYQLAVQQADALTDRMEKRNAEKRAAIAAAKMPVVGLALGDSEVLFNGQPFNQIASGDRIRIQCEIAAALSPELKIIRIQNGSLLDSSNMAAIGTWAEEKGYQVWIEEVDETGNVGIYLEDGEVVAVDGVPVPRGNWSSPIEEEGSVG